MEPITLVYEAAGSMCTAYLTQHDPHRLWPIPITDT